MKKSLILTQIIVKETTHIHTQINSILCYFLKTFIKINPKKNQQINSNGDFFLCVQKKTRLLTMKKKINKGFHCN